MFGGLGNLGNLAGMLKQAKSLQENMQKMQEELAAQRFEADAGAGMVRAEVNGKGELVRLKIDPQAASDVELLEDMVVSAVSAAARKSQEAMKGEMSKLTGGLNLPGLSELLGGAG
jgi:nucleoid-associated protein EbfC